ncbi:hypothetical protein ASPCAL07517 [Aspergillus calidoustus]|uniref:Beta-glucuronidase C-terminal domain-containing protein n=1 Tax=Aspergillus calidoustus TaxID=454130 RepID=A0A0U5CAX7_ASPCI|nr:hypothetical protein ASPCAL07517 [Aspergillus calidoustus]
MTSLFSQLAFSLLYLLTSSNALSITKQPRQEPNTTAWVDAPLKIKASHAALDAAYVSYSFEFQDFVHYTTNGSSNSSDLNQLTSSLLGHLYDRAGAYPMFRPGGEPQDLVVYVPDQEEALIALFDRGDVPYVVYQGPKFVDSVHALPKGLKIVFGLSIGEYTNEGYNNLLAQTENVWTSLGDRIHALEIGNEPEHFPALGIRPSGYSVEDYVSEWVDLSDRLSEALSLPKPIFQGGTFQAPSSGNKFNASRALDLGIAAGGNLKTMSEHQYMGARQGSCEPDTLLNRTIMLGHMANHEILVNNTLKQRHGYVLGETNSCSGHGKEGVSNAYAAAIWAVDYVLYAASFHVERVCLSGGNIHVKTLINETYISAYGIYQESDNRNNGRRTAVLKRVAILDKNPYDEKDGERPYTEFRIPHAKRGATYKKLSGLSPTDQSNVTWAGQTLTGDGLFVGDEEIQPVRNGKVFVGRGEAVLITL